MPTMIAAYSVSSHLSHAKRVAASAASIKRPDYIEGEDTWRARVNADPDQLNSAPEFRYEGKWKR
jgi:hypothetical protein